MSDVNTKTVTTGHHFLHVIRKHGFKVSFHLPPV